MSAEIEIYTCPETGRLEAVSGPVRFEKLARALMRGHVAAVRRGERLAGMGCAAAFVRPPADRLVERPEDLKKLAAPVRLRVAGGEGL